jgi:hypothetical protein
MESTGIRTVDSLDWEQWESLANAFVSIDEVRLQLACKMVEECLLLQ